MFRRLILVVFLVVFLAGCATGSKKQAILSQPVVSEQSQEAYQQESYSKSYDVGDTWSSESYVKPANKTYSEATIQLSPKQIQRALRSAGFYQGSIDGKIGSRTRKAIRKFQAANGLKADGIVGKRTLIELNKYLSQQ